MVTDEATVLLVGRAEISDEGTITVIVERLTELIQAVQQKARELIIRFPTGADSARLSESIRALLEQSKGECDVFVEIVSEDMLVRMRAHPTLKIQGSVELEAALLSLGCEVRWDGFASPTRAAAASSVG